MQVFKTRLGYSGLKSVAIGFVLVFVSSVSSIASADPFDDFVGTYTPVALHELSVKAPGCNRFDFQEMTSFEVRADRTGYRQTHVLLITVPNGYSSISVVPGYRVPNEVDPSIGLFGDSEGDAQKAMTVQGSFGADKNASLTLTIEKRTAANAQTSGAEYLLTIIDAVKSPKDVVLASCTYTAALKKNP